MSAIKNSYDIVFYMQAVNANINGDPSRSGAPRMDILTGKGLISDVCIKRRVRDYVSLAYGTEAGYDLYIKNDMSLNEKDEDALKSLGVSDTGNISKKSGTTGEILDYMCSTYFDIRAFGAVMTTFSKLGAGECGRVCGPVQIDISESLDPIDFEEFKFTRNAITKKEDAAVKEGTFGSRFAVPFAVYRVCMHISAVQAEKTGLTEKDIDRIIEAIKMHPEESRSAMRGSVETKDIFVFRHSSALRNCTFGDIRKCIKEEKRTDQPKCYEDYEIFIDEKALPKNVEVSRR